MSLRKNIRTLDRLNTIGGNETIIWGSLSVLTSLLAFLSELLFAIYLKRFFSLMISTCFSINEVASPEACLISKISNMSGWLIKKSGFASKYSRTSESDIFFLKILTDLF